MQDKLSLTGLSSQGLPIAMTDKHGIFKYKENKHPNCIHRSLNAKKQNMDPSYIKTKTE